MLATSPNIDFADEIVIDTLITHNNEVVNKRIRGLLGLPELKTAEAS